MISLLFTLQIIVCLVFGEEAEKDEGFVLNEVRTIFVSHFGDDSRNDCGTNIAPCQTIEHALTLLKNIDAKSIKIMDELEIKAGSKWNKEFLLEIGSSSPQGISRRLKVDISSSVQKGVSHFICEMEMQLRCLDFCLTQTNQNPTEIFESTFENAREGHTLHQQDAPAIILLDSENGNLKLAHCSIFTLKHLLEPFEFSFLSAKSGKLSITDLDIDDVYKFTTKVSPIIISEKVNVGNLDELKVEHFILEKCSVFEHPKSLTLKNAQICYCERKNENVACVNCSSSAEDVVNWEYTNCLFQYCTSEDSMAGGALSIGMENPNSILEITGCSFQNCKGLCGAGLYLSFIKGTVTISKTSFQSCEVTVGGGGMYVKDANLMKSFTLMEVLFNGCCAENGGGAWIGVGGDEIKACCWFQNCLFSGNKFLESGADLYVSEGGTKSIDKTIFDDKTFSTSEGKSVCVQNASSGDFKERYDLLSKGSLNYFLNTDKGKDDPNCGLTKKSPCLSLKAAVEAIKTKWDVTISCDGSEMMQINQPLYFSSENSINVAGDPSQAHVSVSLSKEYAAEGNGAINVKNNAKLYLNSLGIKIDTTVETTKTSPFVVSSDSAGAFGINLSNVYPSDVKGILSCALFEIHGGYFFARNTNIFDFTSSRALFYFNKDSIDISGCIMSNLKTTSADESIFTLIGDWKEILLMSNSYTECTSPNHKKGGVIYIKYSQANAHVQISGERFESCSCTEGDGTGDGSLGGAVFIEAIDEVVDDLNIYLSQSTFTECVSDVGKWIFISSSKGVSQLTDHCFEFDLNELYGKENLMIVEERQNKEKINEGKNQKNADRVDLLMPGEHQLVYKSTTLYVGGEESVDSRDCGRKEKPCQTIECTEEHVIFGKTNSFFVSGMHTLKRSIIPADYTAFDIGSESKDIATIIIPSTLELYCDDVAVFYCVQHTTTLRSLSIEYPLHFDHRPVDIILIEDDCQLISITLKPSEEELEAYSNQFSVPFLDFKLIVAQKGTLLMSNVVVIGTISEKAASSAIASIDPMLNYRQQEYEKDGIAVNSRNEQEGDVSVCEWSSCLVSIRTQGGWREPRIDNCVFKNIKEGALLITDSVLEMENITFENNRPDPSSKAFPHLRHNIHCEKDDYCEIEIKSLNEKSDGSTDIPFGFWNKECDVYGEAVKSMAGLFYTPELKEAAIEKPSETNPANDNQMDILNKYGLNAKSEESEVTVNMKGEYLIPCGLQCEIGKKEGKGESQWAEVPISEFLNESFLKVKIEKTFLYAKDTETVEIRLRYPNGLENGVDVTSSLILKVGKTPSSPDKSKLTRQQIIIITASACGGAVFIAAVVIVLAICVVRRKRRGYVSFGKSKEKIDINSHPLAN